MNNLADKLKPVPKPQLNDLQIFKKGNFDMKEFKERQDMVDLAKFKDLEGEKVGQDGKLSDGIAEEVKSKTQQAIEDRRRRLKM